MKKFTALLSLVLCMALLAPCALAQYAPGQTMQQLMLDAWNDGQLVTADLQLNMDLNPEALGMSAQDQPYLDAIDYILGASTLSIGAAKLDNGLRVELAGAFNGETAMSVDAAADITLDGLSVECSLLPQRKVTVAWETLLALCGLPQEDVALVMELLHSDFDALTLSLMELVLPYVELASQVALPYVETVLNWVNTLTFEQYTDLPADESYPATDLLLNIIVYESDVSTLICTLCQQLAADQLLGTLLDLAFSQLGAGVTTAQLCNALYNQFEPYTTLSQDPLGLSLGFDENGSLIYTEVYLTVTGGSSVYAGMFFYPTEAPNTNLLDFTAFSMDADGSVPMAISLAGTVMLDPADVYHYDVAGDLMVVADDEVVMEAGLSTLCTPKTDEAGLPGYDMEMVMETNVMDLVTTFYAVVAEYAQTADGGEASDVAGFMEMVVEGTTATMSMEAAMQTIPTEDGFITALTSYESMPSLGYDAYGTNLIFYSQDYVPAALTEVALESLSDAGMNELLNELAAAAQQLMTTFATEALPADIANLIL